MAIKYRRLMNFFKNTSDRGSYLSGSPREGQGFTVKEGERLYIFPNEFKEKENQPDFSLCVKEED